MPQYKGMEKQILEAEVLQQRSRPVGPARVQEERVASPSARAGFFAGCVALSFSVMMLLLAAVVTVFIIFPLMLLGRALGMQMKSFRR